MIRITVLIIIIFISSCSRNKHDEKIYYIISESKSNFDNYNPPPPPAFYGRNNFILLDSNRVIYHSKFGYNDCCTPEEIASEPIINLKKSDLKEINNDSIFQFLENVITDTSHAGWHEFVVIKSPLDTIKNPAFLTIMDFLKDKGIKRYEIRKWTKEEEKLLKAVQ